MKFLSVCVLVVLACGFNAVAFAEKKKAEKEKKEAYEEKVVAVYDLEGGISESGQSGQPMFGVAMDAERPVSHLDVVQGLEEAVKADEVVAIVVEMDQAGMSLAQLQELRRLLLRAKEAGKKVWLYTEYLSFGTALVGSVADELVMMPEGNVGMQGLYNESMYFKGLLDKLGMEAHVVHIGDFKSAGESLYRTEPSEPAKKQASDLLDGMYALLVEQIAFGRGLKGAQVEKLIDSGLVSPKRAKKAKLVDALEYRTDLIAQLREEYAGADFENDYGMEDRSGPEVKGMMDLFKLAFSSAKKKKARSEYVAVVPMEGAISDASIAPVRTEILEAAKDEKCLGLVLRVNSPGGSALSSEVLWEAADEFEKTGKPFAVSMGAVAASGGYYISAGADRIFAEMGTVTGSIGVVGMKFSMGGAMEKLGITTHEEKRGRYADLYSSSRGFSKKEEGLVRKSMEEVYGVFKKRVKEGRGKAIEGGVESLAGGRVYTGLAAYDLGLVDELGGLGEAVSWVREELGNDELKARLFPEPVSPLELMFQQPDEDRGDEFIRMGGFRKEKGISIKDKLMMLPGFEFIDAAKKKDLMDFAIQLESLKDDRVLLMAPRSCLLRSPLFQP